MRQLLLSSLAVLTMWAAEDKPQFVGSDTCQACHQDLYAAFEKNPHRLLQRERQSGGKTKGCEACHGPGGKHAESAAPEAILNPRRLPAEQVNQTCLQCHLNRPTHVGRIQGGHGRNQVPCNACHSMHQVALPLVRRKAAEVNELCGSCHPAVWAEFQRPFKHRLPERAMSCVDCHNPHGSVLGKSMHVAFGNEPPCLKCHGDKRGPFTFEHAPVRLEGCPACHEPHGSTNPRMLRRHEQRFLCLECHANVGISDTLGSIPPAFHDLRSSRFRNCTICHTKIHGSDVIRSLLR